MLLAAPLIGVAPLASAATASTATLVGTYEVCNLPAPPTTTTTDVTRATTDAVPALVILLGPAPMVADLIEFGHVVAETEVGYFIPPGFEPLGAQESNRPPLPRGFEVRYVMRAPSGTYVVRAPGVDRRVTLVAGRITRVDVRRGNCW